ncbi:cytochrome P450 [Metarhizium robertsii]|uniref:Cytochrome P450 n=1 Tax=Metarhizium robertsii TaxID=568076 RepID=A0A014NC02_9HYPO|nr:cytochrome P450 [Metarhizium robertsii]
MCPSSGSECDIRNGWRRFETFGTPENLFHGDFAFQIPTMTRMDIFICDRQMTREYYTVDDDHLSFRAVMSEEFQFEHLLPGQLHDVRRIPNSVIAKALSWQRTRARKPEDAFFKSFSAEFVHGFQEETQRLVQNQSSGIFSLFRGTPPAADSGWSAVPCFPLAIKVIARLTTYSLFGEPLCRDVEFLDMCCRFGDAIPRDALILRSWPAWARPSVAKLLAAPRLVRKLQGILYAEIQQRRSTREKNPMKDLLDFTIDWVDQRGEEYDDWHITDMMTNTIFAALHTSSQLVVHTIFELATRPEYADPLREEIKQCFELHGEGTKKALDSMYKVDSFIKETQRMNPLDASALARLALRDYTFSNGLHIPKGSAIFTPNAPLFQDERFYPDPQRFDGFRFSKMRNDPKLVSSCDLTSTNERSMHFGIGRHACPGRFMVSDEVKLAMVHLLQNFDFCVENFGPRPKNMPFGKFILPDMSAKVWLRPSTRGKE